MVANYLINMNWTLLLNLVCFLYKFFFDLLNLCDLIFYKNIFPNFIKPNNK